MNRESSAPNKFVHLHLHSTYSLLEGAITIKKLQELCSENNMPAVAITDTGNMFAALEFSEVLANSGILVRKMDVYGIKNSLRVTIGKSMENKKLIFRMRRILNV